MVCQNTLYCHIYLERINLINNWERESEEEMVWRKGEVMVDAIFLLFENKTIWCFKKVKQDFTLILEKRCV